MSKKKLTLQQKAAKELIKSDLCYLFTIMKNSRNIRSNYFVSMVPYMGLIIDGAENWVSAMERVAPGIMTAPRFTDEEKKYYEIMRSSIKLWDKPFDQVYALLERYYQESNEYFSSLCKPIAKSLHLYDIFGADLANEHFCGNTILGAVFLPNFHLENKEYGPHIRKMTEIGGRYIAAFNAMEPLKINNDMHFEPKDYGGFVKSPVGNKFSYRFVLYSILCQINFVLYAVDAYIVPEIPAKLRFAYILYFYLCGIISQINETYGTSFTMNQCYYSQEFRNAMAHYKVGVYMKTGEIIQSDPMFGMTQKAFLCDFYETKNAIIGELQSLSKQIETYLGIA